MPDKESSIVVYFEEHNHDCGNANVSSIDDLLHGKDESPDQPDESAKNVSLPFECGECSYRSKKQRPSYESHASNPPRNGDRQCLLRQTEAEK